MNKLKNKKQIKDVQFFFLQSMVWFVCGGIKKTLKNHSSWENDDNCFESLVNPKKESGWQLLN